MKGIGFVSPGGVTGGGRLCSERCSRRVVHCSERPPSNRRRTGKGAGRADREGEARRTSSSTGGKKHRINGKDAGASAGQRSNEARSNDKEDFSAEYMQKVLVNAGFQPVDAKVSGSAKQQKSEATKTKPRSMRPKDIIDFERNGHVAGRKILLREEVDELRNVVLEVFEKELLEAYRQKCIVYNLGRPTTIEAAQKMLAKVDPERIPFLQLFNLRKKDARLKIPKSVVKAAADLLGAKRLRVYQDSLFVKRPGDGPTLWHSDLNMAPIDTNRFLTVWIPLQDVDEDASPLCFASKSHRDFSFCYWRGREYLRGADLSRRYEIDSHDPLEVGDVTFHDGWTLHGAPGLDDHSEPRIAFAVSFFDEEHTRMLPEDFQKEVEGEDQLSYEYWAKDVKDFNAPLQHQALELLYPFPES